MNAVELGPIWPSASQIARMGPEERGYVLSRLQDRQRELSLLLDSPETVNFQGTSGVAELDHESVLLDELIEIVSQMNYLIPGEPV